MNPYDKFSAYIPIMEKVTRRQRIKQKIRYLRTKCIDFIFYKLFKRKKRHAYRPWELIYPSISFEILDTPMAGYNDEDMYVDLGKEKGGNIDEFPSEKETGQEDSH